MKINKKILFFLLVSAIFIIPNISLAQSVPGMVILIKNAFLTVGSTIIVIGWIIAGILYLTSAGSPEKTGIAKKALFACVIGTVLIILAAFAEPLIYNLIFSGGAAPQ